LLNGYKQGAKDLPKILESKRGISPILATLLLIVIAVAAIIVTYAWVMTFMKAQTTAGGILLEMENVNWPGASTVIDIRNVGTSDARIVRLYIGNTISNLTEVTSATDIGDTGRLLKAHNRTTIILSWPNALATSWTSGRIYYFKVVPEAGHPLEFQHKPP
jgi:flagellin-like protein